MTNYEWLVKKNALGEFISDIIKTFDNPKLKGKYGMIINWGDDIAEKIAEWLQSPHQ